MKIGVCTSMNPSLPDRTGLEYMEAIKRAGFDYIEAPIAQLMAMDTPSREALITRLLDADLPILSFNNLFPPGIRLTGPDVDAVLIDGYFDSVMALGKRLGVETVIFGSGPARNIPMGFSHQKAWNQLAAMLRRLAPKAAASGITIVLEHLNHLESNIADSFAEGMRLVREVDHPNFRGFVDYYHLGIGNESLELVEENFDLIRHAHFANLLGRTIPIHHLHEQGVVDFIRMLQRNGYRHKLSVEGYGVDIPARMVEAADFLRAHM